MKIQVFGTTPPCARCKATEKVVREIVKEFGYDDIEVIKKDVFSEESERLGIMMSPTTVIEGKILKTGRVPSKEEMNRVIEKMEKEKKKD